MSCVPQKQELGLPRRCSCEEGREAPSLKCFLQQNGATKALLRHARAPLWPACQSPLSFPVVVDSQAWLCSENQQTPRQEAFASFYQMVPGLVMASPDNSR